MFFHRQGDWTRRCGGIVERSQRSSMGKQASYLAKCQWYSTLGKFIISFYVALGMELTADLKNIKFPAIQKVPCWNWILRCGRNNQKLHEIRGEHYITIFLHESTPLHIIVTSRSDVSPPISWRALEGETRGGVGLVQYRWFSSRYIPRWLFKATIQKRAKAFRSDSFIHPCNSF